MIANISTLRELQDVSPIEIINRLKTHFGFSTDSQLARWMGVSSQNLHSIKARGSFPITRLADISERLVDRSLEDIMGISNKGDDQEDFCTIPLVEARLSVETGSLETSQHEKSSFAFQKDWLRCKGHPDKIVLMRNTGDSMEPLIRHNGFVLVDQGSNYIVPLGIYAVAFNDMIDIKQLRPQSGRRLELHSLNPEYPPIMVDLSEDSPDDFRVIGRVVWHCDGLP